MCNRSISSALSTYLLCPALEFGFDPTLEIMGVNAWTCVVCLSKCVVLKFAADIYTLLRTTVMILNRKSAKIKGLAQTLMSLSVQFIHLDVSFIFISDRQRHIRWATGWMPASVLQHKTLLSSLPACGKNTGKRPPGWKWLGKLHAQYQHVHIVILLTLAY